MKTKYPNIKKIKSQDLKELGFKSKAIATKFAKILNINIKKFDSEKSFLDELKTSLNRFKSIGLDFNDTLKKLDLSSSKVRQNRETKKEKKFNELKDRVKEKIQQLFYIHIIDDRSVKYLTKKEPTDIVLQKSSDHYLKFKDFKFPTDKNYVPIEKTEHSRKKTIYLPFEYDIYNKDLSQFKNYLLKIYNDQKFTFKITFEFSFLLVLSDQHRQIGDKTEEKAMKYNYQLEYKLYYASTNTRLQGFENPVVVDNKKDIESIISKVEEKDLILDLVADADSSRWKFYKFLGITFHIYEMNTPIGRSNELPVHYKQGSNEKALIKYENYDDYLCFWRCLAYHIKQPKDTRNVKKEVKLLFSDYYGDERSIENYSGVEYVAYDKEYSDEALDNEEYEQKNDELDLIEKKFEININVYTNDEPDIIQIDRRSITNYDDTMNLMRYNNHFMYIKDLKQIRHCYRCKKCSKMFKNMEACNRHEKNCDELVKHTFPGGKYDKSKSIFDKIEDVYDDLLKKEKTYRIYNNFNPVVDNDDDKYYPYECAFDFEAMLKKIDTIDDSKQLQITSEHVPVSVSIFSNVPEYDVKPIFLCNNKPAKLINNFIQTILEISLKAKSLNQNKYANIIEFLDAYVTNVQSDYDRFKDNNGPSDKYDDKKKKLSNYHESSVKKATSLKSQFENWYLALPVLSFNGAKYDINLMKQYLHKALEDNGESVSFSIK